MSDLPPQTVPCPRCDQPMRSAIVRTDIWQGDGLFIVEDIPAQICDACFEQYYDDSVTDAIRQLSEEKFPATEAKREILVPVFSLTGRIRTRTAPVDYEQY